MIEMLSDDNVLDQVANKLVDKLTDRASEQFDLSAMMDDTTLAKAAKDEAPPPRKTVKAPPPPKEEGGGFFAGFAQAWENLGGGVTPTMSRDSIRGGKVPRGMREFKQKALPEPMSQGAFAGPK